MGFFYSGNNDIYQYGIWKTEENEKTLQELSGCNAPLRILNPFKRIEFLAVRSLAKIMGVNPKGILYLQSGKPFLIDGKLNISISHTKGYVAILLSKNEYSAIDIEIRSDRIFKVRKKYMHTDEEIGLQASGTDEETGLLLHWCAKEALFKAIPYEGIDFVRELRIYNFAYNGETGRFKAMSLRDDRAFIVDYRIERDFVLTCCFSE